MAGLKAKWKQVPLTSVAVSGTGLSLGNPATMAKLAASMRRHGQLQPVVVRRVGKEMHVVKGRRIAQAAQAAGLEDVWVVDVGATSDAEALSLAMSLLLAHDVDYAKVAGTVAAALDAGATPAELAACTPFDEQRVRYFKDLCSFDWSQFAGESEQAAMNWNDEPEPAQDEQVPYHHVAEVPMVEVEAAETIALIEADAAEQRQEAAGEPSLFDLL
jgi:hypothetical protein